MSKRSREAIALGHRMTAMAAKKKKESGEIVVK